MVPCALAPLVVLAACGGNDGNDDGRVHVVASFYPVAEIAGRVGGDRVDVANLTPAGTEPHDLELTPDEAADIEDADLVVYLGEGFQPSVADMAGRQGDRAVDLADALPLDDGEGADDGSEIDPHFWLDPQLMSQAVDVVETALAKASPEDEAAFAANAKAYKAELAALDGDFEAGLASCERDQIVTSHAAFHYLARAYGLEQLPIAGLSPESEPDPERLADLAEKIESEGITTVFYEELVSPDVAETLAREAHVTAAVLNPLEGLTSKQVSAGDDYASIMRDNLAALRKALGCA
jgi:zinc transport system substrate-binding protein